MKKKFTTVFMFISQICTIASQDKSKQLAIPKLQSEFECDPNVLSFMSFRFNYKCVQFVRGNGTSSVDCTAKIIQRSRNITFYVRSMTWLLNRNIFRHEPLRNASKGKSTKNCENFLIFSDGLDSMKSIVEAVTVNSNDTAVLYAFSKLYFIFEDRNYLLNKSDINELSDIFTEKAHFGYIFEFHSDTNKTVLRDLLTRQISESRRKHRNLIHPFVDRRNRKKQFRVRFNTCYPYVIIENATERRFAGVEYHLLQHVVSNWNVTYVLPKFVNGIAVRNNASGDDLNNKLVDIKMCSVWLGELDYYQYDLSTFHNHECYTLLTPKPVKLSEVTAIYKTFSTQIWITFGSCFVVIGLLLWSSARIHKTEKTVYTDLSRTFLEVTNIATSHGVGYFPKHHSINILLLSWILLCLWIGICYTTVYTSLLTSPGYTKIIDSIEEFLDNDMLYGVRRLYKVAEESLRSSSNPAYQQLQTRCRVFKDRNDIETSIHSGRYAVFGAFSNGKYFTSVDWLNETTLFANFRFMKKTCIFDHYSVFGFKKISPYTELFSDHALRFQENGFSHYWYKKIYRDKRQFDSFFEDYPIESKEPKQLTIESIRGALSILIVCVGLSIVVFICEIIF